MNRFLKIVSARQISYFLILLGIGLYRAPKVVFAQVPDSLIQQLMTEYNVPGLSLAVVRSGEIEALSWGFADSKQSIPVTAATPFRLASVAKVFVAASVAASVNEGTVRFSDDISSLIPQRGYYSGPITYHDLLTHSAGFDDRVIGYAARSQSEMLPLGQYLKDFMPERGWPTGQLISYSNHGMSLAAFGLENRLGIPFEEIAQKNVFGPLGMTSTSFYSRSRPFPKGAAQPLACTDEGCTEIGHTFSHPYPAGLAFSTSEDMGRFIQAMLTSETSKSSLNTLIPQRFSNDKRLPGMSYAFFNQVHRGYRFLAHAGNVPGYWSLLLVSPDADFGFFFNTNGGSSRFGEKLRDILLTSYLGKEKVVIPNFSITEDASIRDGSYEATRYSHNTIERFPQVFHNTIQLRSDGDTLNVIAGGRIAGYLQSGPDEYIQMDGTDRLVFAELNGKPHLYKASVVYGAALPMAYEKLAWYHAPSYLNEYISWLVAAPLLIMLLAWPLFVVISYLKRRKRKKKLSASAVAGLLFCTHVLFAWFGLGFVAKSNRMLNTGELFFGMPQDLLNLTWIPIAHLLFSCVLVSLCVAVWKKSWWDIGRRLLYSLLTIALLLQISFLIQWNYVPLAW